jgi:hypothetical protein
MHTRIVLLALAFGFAARAEDVATARKLEEMRLPVSAFFFYGDVLRGAKPGAEAAGAAAAVQRLSDALHDEMFGPNLLAKLDAKAIAALPKAAAPRLHAALALLQYRAGKFEAAQREADAVPKDSEAFPQAQYVAGLLAQRASPERAVAVLNGVLSDGRSSGELRERISPSAAPPVRPAPLRRGFRRDAKLPASRATGTRRSSREPTPT